MGDGGLQLDDVELGVDRVAELHGRGAIQLVDVRELSEWREDHIPGARHIELDRLVSSSATIDRNAPVVFYCRLGGRAGLAAAAFRGAGYDAYSMVGGMLAWSSRELPVESVSPVAG